MTAPPMTRAAIDNPSRGAVPQYGRTNTAKSASENRRASRYTRSNSDLLRRRCAAVNDRVREGKSNGQALTPLGAAPSQNLAAGTRGHARTEPVSARAMQVAGLISALHDFSPAAKLALKQAHGAPKEGRQAYAPSPRVSSEALVRTGVGGKFRSARRGSPPVDNPAGLRLDSRLSRVTWGSADRGRRLPTWLDASGRRPTRGRCGIQCGTGPG